MSLICGDIHGHHLKAKMFLEFKPEEEHIFVGDYLDSYTASDDDILTTFEMIMESGAYTLAGNHELPYLPNPHPYFACSGNRPNPEFRYMVNKYKEQLKGAFLVDDHIITHGGITAGFGKVFDNAEQCVEFINQEFTWYKNQPVTPPTLSQLFYIPGIRGGREQYGGPFWASIGYEKFCGKFNQVVGHTPKKEPYIQEVGKHVKGKHRIVHVAIDSPKFICYNTKTKMFEDYCSEEYKNDDQMRSILERTF